MDIYKKMRNLIKNILKEEYHKRYEKAYENKKLQKLIPLIKKYLDKVVIIDMIVPSTNTTTTYEVYFEDHPEVEEHYCMGCSGLYHYPTGNNDIYTASEYEDNEQFASAVEMALGEVFGIEETYLLYEIVHKFILDKIKNYMDNDPINDYPEEHDMDW